MTAVQKNLATLLVLLSWASAQPSSGPGSVLDFTAAPQGHDVRVDILLSAAAKPLVTTAKHPDRLIIDLKNTLPGSKRSAVVVNSGGVREIRVGLNSANPAVTRVVVDLEQAQPYVVNSDGNLIIVIISPALGAKRDGAPAAAASGGLGKIFARRKKSDVSVAQDESSPDLIPPPPSQPPIVFSPDARNGATTTVASARAHDGRHPDRGSLQEGTVFPGNGSPGAGVVPAAGSKSPGSFDAATAASSPASASNGTAINPNFQTPTVSQPGAAVSGSTADTSHDRLAAPPAPVQPVAVASSPMTAPASQSQPFPHSSLASAGQGAVASETKAVPMAATVEPSKASSESGSAKATEVSQAMPAPEVSSPAESGGATDGIETSSPSSIDSRPELTLRSLDPNLRTIFKVKYVADGVAYLDGGRSSGLDQGMKLEIRDSDLPPEQGTTVDPADPRVIAELEISGLADTSAVTDIHSPKRPVKVGDLAYLSSTDAQALVQQRTLSATRKYPAVVTFTEGDPLDEEVRAEVPRPPLPSVNRARGRIGLDYTGIISHGATGLNTSDLGLVVRTDITRINGTYWNLSGYWRGRIDSRSSTGQPTLQDLLNRTYHINLTYDNPNSAWVAGFGRLYLPWAPSLETIDGGYFGRRFGKTATVGIFGGSTPDPTSYSYNPDQQIAGTFVNFEGGKYEAMHYTSTSGLGIELLKLQVNRPFVFFENTVSFKNRLSIYDSLQADSPQGNQAAASPGPGLSRNFLTVRYQLTPRVELHFNQTYFRDIPTFDPTLIGTGLLDKYLFQGFSAGARVEVVKHISVYSDLGRSSASTDTKNSLNQLYGITFDHLPWVGVRADAHYSRFNSSFGDGTYESLSFSRSLNDALRLEVLAGQQNFTSLLSAANRTRFLNANVESTLGRNFFLQGGFTFNRGSLSYDQWSFTLGYRFDSKAKRQ